LICDFQLILTIVGLFVSEYQQQIDFLPRDATQSAVMRLHIVRPSVCP